MTREELEYEKTAHLDDLEKDAYGHKRMSKADRAEKRERVREIMNQLQEMNRWKK